MSGIAGIYHLDGAPVDPAALRRMAEAAAFRGPDGINFWIEGNIGLAHLALHTTPEALRERQPLLSRDGRLCLAADARVDNRAELIRALTSRGARLEDPTDADLILAAYEVWGTDCPKEIVGDFAFAVWDGRERRLFCARDPIGIRPLFYCRRGQTLFFASTIESIVAGLGERPPWNEPLLVDYLCWWFDRWVDETIFEGIRRLPAAHGLEARPEGERLARYWTLGLQPGPGYKTDAEYLEHFRDLFAEAVRCRLRSNAPVGISVSGGLDSSSIACMAHHLLEQGEPQPPVRLYSCVFTDSSPADEHRYLQAVLEKCPLFPATCIPGEELWGFQEEVREGAAHLDEPDIYPIRSLHTSILRKVRSHGCRVLLTGEGGDQVLASGAYWQPWLIADIELGQVAREFRHFWRRTRWAALPSLARRMVAQVLKPLMPQRVFLWWQLLLQQAHSRDRWRHIPAWVNQENVRFLGAAGLAEDADPTTWLPNRSAVAIYKKLTGGWYAACLSYLCSVGALLGIEHRLPFLDRRLADFLLQTPRHLRFAEGRTKVILRRVLAGFLPEEVRERTNRAVFGTVTNRGISETELAGIQVLLDEAASSLERYLRKDRLAFFCRRYYNAIDPPARVLLAPLFFQVWLRSLPQSSAIDRA